MNLGLALGGGSVLGAAHVGVLKYLEENNIYPQFISGTSIGALVGSLYAFGLSAIEIEEIALKMKWSDITGLSRSTMGIFSNRKMDDFLRSKIGDKRIEDSNIPLALVATDLMTGEKIVLKQGSVIKAVKASTCIPGLFIPVELDDKVLVDGGILENCPVPTCRSMGADIVIGVDLKSKMVFNKPKSVIGVLYNSFQFTLRTVAKYQTLEAEILLQPDLSSFSLFNIKNIKSIVDAGYKEAKLKLKNHKDLKCN